MEEILKDMTGVVVNKQFALIRKLGGGAFGDIYLAQHGKDEYAIKIERSDSKHPQLHFEFKLYTYLNMHQAVGIPKVYGIYTQENHNFMIMELLGKSLEDQFTEYGRRFSLQTVAVLGIQMLECIEFLQQKQFIHRDIKPDNFLMGKVHHDRVYMVDFGLAKRYISKDIHIAYRENKALTGTARYASINTHLGIEQSRRDDLESLGYVLMYFLRGQLPWQNLRANTQKEKYDRIMEKKLATSSESLCKGYSNHMCDFIEYSKNLKFDEKPDYQYLKTLFIQMIKENQLRLEYIYDWDDENTHRDKIQIQQHTEEKLPTLKQTTGGAHTKTSSMASINKIQRRTQQCTAQVYSQFSKAKQILKKHSSLHYQ